MTHIKNVSNIERIRIVKLILCFCLTFWHLLSCWNNLRVGEVIYLSLLIFMYSKFTPAQFSRWFLSSTICNELRWSLEIKLWMACNVRSSKCGEWNCSWIHFLDTKVWIYKKKSRLIVFSIFKWIQCPRS